MALEILPYTADRIEAVRAFNQRLASRGISAAHEQFPETPDPGWLPGLELFLAADGASVHGGYILRRQRFSANGQEISAAHYRLPLSEGGIDRAYAMLGLRMVRDVLSRHSRLYSLRI